MCVFISAPERRRGLNFRKKKCKPLPTTTCSHYQRDRVNSTKLETGVSNSDCVLSETCTIFASCVWHVIIVETFGLKLNWTLHSLDMSYLTKMLRLVLCSAILFSILLSRPSPHDSLYVLAPLPLFWSSEELFMPSRIVASSMTAWFPERNVSSFFQIVWPRFPSFLCLCWPYSCLLGSTSSACNTSSLLSLRPSTTFVTAQLVRRNSDCLIFTSFL